jgi:guanylate kinase
LRARGTEGDASVAVRLENARWEVGFAPHYRYWVVNDRLETAIEDLRAVLRAERLRRARGDRPPLSF